MTPREVLDLGADQLALSLSTEARDKLMAYLTLLMKWNRTYNLTAVRDPLQAVSTHLLDSLAIVKPLADHPGTLADVGSGGGLPGIALAIADPAREVTLNDVNEKKGAFLRQAIIELGLRNARVHVGRVEDWQPPERFAIVVARGFASLAQFIRLCRHLVLPSGLLAAMKGVHPAAELAAVPDDCDCGQVLPLHVPYLGAERHLVLCKV